MEYEFVQLGSVCTFENGDRGKAYPNEEDFIETGIPFVNGGHIINGKIDISQLNYISEKKYSQLRAGKASRGDILFSLRGSLGKCVRNPFEKAAIASALVIVRPNEKIDARLKVLIEETCAEYSIDVIEMEIMPDHVHLLLEVDPQFGIHKAVKRIKGRTSRILRQEYPFLKSRLPTLWTNSYFVSTVGGAPLSVIKQYIENQKND